MKQNRDEQTPRRKDKKALGVAWNEIEIWNIAHRTSQIALLKQILIEFHRKIREFH